VKAATKRHVHKRLFKNEILKKEEN